MEKKELPKKANNAQSKIAGFSNRIFSISKFVLGVCLLPFVWASSVSFINEFTIVEKTPQNYFWSGLISLLIIYLFIWEPAIIYTKGQKLLEAIFIFFKPLVRIASYLLPIYTIVLFIAYGISSYVFKSKELINYFVFLFGFSIGLHLIFSARSIHSKQGDFLRANYIFGFSLIYIINLTLLAFVLSFVFENFSFVNFFNNSFLIGKKIFYAIFKKLFLS